MRSFEIKKAISAVTATAIYKVMIAAQPLIFTPLMLHNWGAELFGEWILTNSFVAIVLMFHSGLSQASSADIIRSSFHLSTGDLQNKSGVLSFGAAIALVTGLTILAASSLVGFDGKRIEFLHVAVEPQIFVLLAFGMVLNLYATPVMTATAVRSGASLPMLYSTMWKAIETVGCVAAILFGGSLLAAAWCLAITALFGLGSQLILLRITVGSWSLALGRAFVVQDVRRLVVPSVSAFFLFFSSNVILLHGTRVLIHGMFGPAALAVTTAITTYFRSARFLMAIVPHGLQVELGLLLHKNDPVRSYRILSSLSSVTAGTSGLLCLLALVAAPVVLRLWTPGIPADICILVVLASAAFAGCLFDFWSTLLSSVNRIVWLSLSQFLTSVVCIAAFYVGDVKPSICWVLSATTLPDVVGVIAGIAVTKNLVGSPKLTTKSLFIPEARELMKLVRGRWSNRK